jgi:tyrosine-protein kinase Etk/Wzc
MASPAVAIVDPATVDPDPVRPHRGLNLVVFLTAGLLLGVGGALLFDSLRRTIRTAQDVESELGLPVLATLPTRG